MKSNQNSIAWDVVTRILHWLIAISVFLNLFILDEGEIYHEWAGYVALVSMFVRLVWSFFSLPASRLSALPVNPKKISDFIKSRFDNSNGKYVGHNPLASITYIFIWSMVFLLGISGWMMGLDAFWGEEWLEKIHGLFSDLLMSAIGLHILGFVIDSFRYRRHTWLSMVTGRK